MFQLIMSNSTSISEESSHLFHSLSPPPFTPMTIPPNHQPPTLHQPKVKKKRCKPGNPDPGAEVVALSPTALMTTNRFVCEVCSKGFQREQNLQLHRRGHNLPWKLKHKASEQQQQQDQRKRVYVCPEESCVHHHPSRALGDLTGIKKHFFRKHGEKRWRCERCAKRYAVHSDWKAHLKICGTKEYRCHCGILFSRKDSFITHRAFCDALAQETARLTAANAATTAAASQVLHHLPFLPWDPLQNPNPNPNPNPFHFETMPSLLHPQLSATALLQKAATMGPLSITGYDVGCSQFSTWQDRDRLTRDFLGVEEGMLSLTALGLDLVTAAPEGDRTAEIGFAPVNEAWGDC